MVFGLINAPYEFSRLMQRVLQPLKNKVAMWYLDDILIPASSFEDMLQRLRLVLDALREANLTLKINKCFFAYREVAYLGYMLSAEGIRPGEQKIKAIQQMSRPQNRHEVRRFLGLTGFFRRFIPKYAELARSVSDLLKEAIPFQWGEKEDMSFCRLRDELVKSPVLKLFDPSAETEVHCDASSHGIDGMLLQKGSDKRFHLVHAVSKKTTPAEKNYHSSKMELMAVVWSLSRMRPYLLGMHFTVVTDCQAIVHLNTQRTVNPQIARWATLLSEYNYSIKHRSGRKMDHVDALSRAPLEDPVDTEASLEGRLEVFAVMTEEEQVLATQRSDARLKTIINILSRMRSERSTIETEMVKDHVLQNGLLYKEVMVGNMKRKLWVVPNSMRKSIVIKFHDLAGHFALDRTVSKIL